VFSDPAVEATVSEFPDANIAPFKGLEVVAEVPKGMRPRRSGTLKVVVPFPDPYVVLITANRFAYSVRSIACPLQYNQPEGSSAFITYGTIMPGNVKLIITLR
jgi:hypothetical protein